MMVLAGCPSAQDETTIPETCTKTGDKCKYQPGQLGVCMMNADGSFYCASQH